MDLAERLLYMNALPAGTALTPEEQTRHVGKTPVFFGPPLAVLTAGQKNTLEISGKINRTAERYLELMRYHGLVLSEPERLTELPQTPEVGALRALAGLLGAAGRTLTVPGNGAAEVLWTLWSGTDWAERLQRASRDGGESGRRADRDLDAVIALFAAAAATEQPAGAGGVRGFLAEVAAQEIPADTTREAEVRGRGVRLLTAHRAKGLEWAVVVVAGVQEGLWPAPGQGGAILDPAELLSDGLVGRPDSRESLADERRLFHLACSRARQRLIVTAVQGSDGEANQPSRFIAELGVPVTDYVPSSRPLTLPALSALRNQRQEVARMRDGAGTWRDLDLVFQANAPSTVSSFMQRMGRTGRRDGTRANTTFFCEDPEASLQAVALIELARRRADAGTAAEAGTAVFLLIKSGSDECGEHGGQNEDLFHGWFSKVGNGGRIKRRRWRHERKE